MVQPNLRLPNLGAHPMAPSPHLVLDSIVEERRDCLVRAPSVFKNQAADTKKMYGTTASLRVCWACHRVAQRTASSILRWVANVPIYPFIHLIRP
jgi:hypothetical protein